jgi:hypothetical protein
MDALRSSSMRAACAAGRKRVLYSADRGHAVALQMQAWAGNLDVDWALRFG